MGNNGLLGVTVNLSNSPGVFTIVDLVSSDTAVWAPVQPTITFGPGQLVQTFDCLGSGAGSADLTLSSRDASRITSAENIATFSTFGQYIFMPLVSWTLFAADANCWRLSSLNAAYTFRCKGHSAYQVFHI